jgi:acyl dehydratase
LLFNWIAPSGPNKVRLPYPPPDSPGDITSSPLLRKLLANPTNPQEAVNLRSLTWDNFQDFTPLNVQANDLLVFTGSGNGTYNAAIVGDISLNIDSTAHTLDAQINPGVIVDADINANAAIDQTKLTIDNTYATTVSGFTGVTASGNGTTATLSFSSSSATAPYIAGQRIVVSGLSVAGYNGTWTVATCTTGVVTFSSTTTGAASGGTIKPLKGIASFDTTQFTITDGWVTLKSNGTTINRLEQIATLTVLGNSTLGTANVSQVNFSSVVDLGLGVKKAQYSSTGFLRRTSSISNSADVDYTIVEAAAGTALSPEAGKLVIRDSSGDFGARVVDLSQLKIDANVGIDTATTATGGYIRYYGYNTVGGILIQSGSLAGDAKTAYWNDAHNFKTKDGLSDAPITASSIQVGVITTGGNTTSGTITGRWTLTGTSPNESRLQSTYSADLAEYYEGDKEYEVGTVLVYGGDKEVTIEGKYGNTRVAGVVSNTAAFAMYDACPGFKNLVALQGRVPVKVVGKIQKGDLLVTSKIPGVAVSAGEDARTGTVIGKALETYDSDHIGTIEVAVGRS